ncbi:hypothetical protein J7F03_05215 [Streptomyces sp. ISL-43]|uniref:hypothetical protein n=1 Tax=Streptomyces sp. ISL-43 TaxID=2819183 RepID=UPI001BEC59ED|nr:hypothetical protein [Streptomyces sp. ISL-43]MBT2446493.1 hypothetical protein [Streptomyces sp. ISL-43]
MGSPVVAAVKPAVTAVRAAAPSGGGGDDCEPHDWSPGGDKNRIGGDEGWGDDDGRGPHDGHHDGHDEECRPSGPTGPTGPRGPKG